MVRNDYVEKRYSGLMHHFRKRFAVSDFSINKG